MLNRARAHLLDGWTWGSEELEAADDAVDFSL
jgi:hypothetical protein